MSSPKRHRVTACPTLVNNLPLPVDVIQLIQAYTEDHPHCTQCATCQGPSTAYLYTLLDLDIPRLLVAEVFSTESEACLFAFESVMESVRLFANLIETDIERLKQDVVKPFYGHPTISSLMTTLKTIVECPRPTYQNTWDDCMWWANVKPVRYS